MSGSVSVMSPQSGSRARRVAAVHIVEVVATCLFLVAVGQTRSHSDEEQGEQTINDNNDDLIASQ